MERYSRKDYQIEKRDPALREKIRRIINEVGETGLETFSYPQIARFFGIKARFIRRIQEKRYVSPGIMRDGRHPSYDRKQLVALVYIHRHGNNLTAFLVEEIHKIINEETPDDKDII